MWHHDYLHLRPIARDLEARITVAVRQRVPRSVLDLGCGGSPYRRFFGEVESYVRVDLDRSAAPDVVAHGEALPFQDDAFDHVLSTQLLQLAEDPAAVVVGLARVIRPGGTAWVTLPLGWPYDAARAEHRFGTPELARLFEGLRVVEIVLQGGMLGVPSSVVNLVVRETVRAIERRLGAGARILRVPAAAVYAMSNAAGRTLETLATRGPLAPLLGFLDARMPQNILVVAERPQ